MTASPAMPQHRVTVTSAEGAPLVNTDVVVEQIRHAFGFGNIGFEAVPTGVLPPALDRAWFDLFNTATLPFYWADFERERGAPATAALAAAAEGFHARGVRVKGHPLVWHTLAPSWLLGLSDVELEEVVRARVRREVRDFRGLVDVWDVINEVVIMPVFEQEENGITRLAQRLGRVGIVTLAVEEARAVDPTVALHLNDFDLSPAYERLIDECLEAGIRFDGLGLQTHMHQGYKGEEYLVGVADRYARFGLPLHFTETTLVSGDLMPPHIVDLNDFQPESWPSTPEGEQRQADEVERHYRSLVAHPAVASITYWGITDAGAWLGAPAGLVRADGTLKPVWHRLHDLIRGEWWLAPTTRRTDAQGAVEFAGAAGDYRVSVGQQQGEVSLTGEATTAETSVMLSREP